MDRMPGCQDLSASCSLQVLVKSKGSWDMMMHIIIYTNFKCYPILSFKGRKLLKNVSNCQIGHNKRMQSSPFGEFGC